MLYLGGLLVLAIAGAITGYMMYASWQTVILDERKEERRIFNQLVDEEAERMFEEARYCIHYSPVEFKNETDIRWN